MTARGGDDPLPPQTVVPLRHPWTWLATAVVVLIAALVLFSVATNPGFEWPVVAQYLFDTQILIGLSGCLGTC